MEPDVPGAFIITDPLESMRSGNFNKVPIITGLTEDEGILLFSACRSIYLKIFSASSTTTKFIFPTTFYRHFEAPKIVARSE